MTTNTIEATDGTRYARVIAASKRARWDIDTDVIRGRRFDAAHKFLPDGLSLVHRVGFLTEPEKRFFSQVQGRTYAKMFGLVERFVTAEAVELSRGHLLGNQTALEALVRFGDEELKHQELFRRVEVLAGEALPEGYHFALDPDAVAAVVLGKPAWSVLALICLIELVTQAHYKESIAPDDRLSELFKDVFRFHWMEESQHAVLDELEWIAEDRRLERDQRDQGVTALIELVAAVDGLLQVQAAADARYFVERAGRSFDAKERDVLATTFLEAYRYQYILSGVQGTRFPEILGARIDQAQLGRIEAALAALA